MQISDRSIRAIKIPSDKKSVRVTIAPHLSVLARYADNGKITRSYCFRTTINGKQIQEMLGSVNDLTFRQAIAMAEERQEIALQGRKPKETIKAILAEREAQIKINAYTFGDAVQDWQSTRANMSALTHKHTKYFLRKLDSIMNTPLKELTIDAVRQIVNEYLVTDKKSIVQGIVGIVNSIAEFAVDNDRLESNPFLRLKRLVPAKTVRHFKSVDPDVYDPDITKLIKIIVECKRKHIKDFLLVGIFSLLRPVEASLLYIEDINYEDRLLNCRHTKMGVDNFKVPLSDPFITILKDVIGDRKSGYINVKGSPLLKEKGSLYLRQVNAPIVPHGWRSMGLTWMVHNGIDINVGEACLCHQIGNEVTRAYFRSNMLDERREAMRKWHEYLWLKLLEAGYKNN